MSITRYGLGEGMGEKYNSAEVDTIQNKKVFTLVIYDIVNSKRRSKLVKFLNGYGFRVQKSAFEAMLSEKKYNKLISKIGRYASKDDNIRVYRIRGRGQVMNFGRIYEYNDEDVIII